MPRVDEDFKDRVYGVVAQIPTGRVMTYGQIAALCGASWAAWEVGQIAHTGPTDLPWHRVVNKQGGLAKGYAFGGLEGHKRAIEADGVEVNEEYQVDVRGLLWNPGQTPLIVVVVGQTASGKSALALSLAQKFNGEVIAADSRTIYRGMNVGTAKPSNIERELVRHHLIDVANMDEVFTVADFKALANEAIRDIVSRGKLPIVVGGTGLYIDALLYDFQLRAPADPRLRAELESLSVKELQDRLQLQGISLPSNAQNPRHLVRQLETKGETPTQNVLRSNTLTIGLEVVPLEIKQRIIERVDNMVAVGLKEEVASLVKKYGWQHKSLQTIGYQEWRGNFEGHLTIEDVREAIIKNTVQYAKRQRTWFKRNKSIHWITGQGQAVELVTTVMNK